MPQYFTSAGLDTLAQFESGGNPTATNPASSASGLYGFLNRTWAQFAPQAGVDTSQFPTAASAPANVQTAVAAITPVSNWTCPGCDPGITNAISGDSSLVASTPASNLLDNVGLSVSAPGVPQDGGIAADIAGSVSMGDNPFQTVPTGSAAGAPGASAAPGASGVWSAIFGDIQNLAARFGLVLLGIVLIGVGAWAAARGEFSKG